MKFLQNNWQRHFVAILGSAVFILWLFWLNSTYFSANISSPVFEKEETSTWSTSGFNFNSTWYDIIIDNFIWNNNTNWALNISTWDAQNEVLSISFKIKYSPTEVLIKQDIETIWINSDFLDIDVDNQNWITEINIINLDALNIEKNTDFVKLELSLNKNLVNWDVINLEITDVEIIDKDLKILQWKWRAWKITIVPWETQDSNLLVMNSYFNNENSGSFLFNDYIKTIWEISVAWCDKWSNLTFTWWFLKDWKNINFTSTWILAWEICRLNFDWFEWNSKNILKENIWYITWFNSTWTSITSISNIFKNSFQAQFSWWNKSDIENPTNYKLLKWDNFSPTLWEKITSIFYDENTKIATFNVNKIFDKNQKYTLIANQIPWISSNNIISFLTENTWNVELISINPNICNLETCNAVIKWKFLDNVLKFFIWNTETSIILQENSSATIEIPVLEKWKYDLIAIDKNNKKIILENVFTFTDKRVQNITINSENSYASPARILNNSLMKTTLWTVISWINWVNDINRVTADLRPLWWSPVAQMKRVTVADQKIWFSLEWVIAHPTAQTSEEAIEIKITAEDTNWLKNYWTISLYVTNNLILSSTPKIENPSIVYNKKENKISPFVKITDDDWIHDIQTVTVDLSSFWLWFQVLKSIDKLWKTISRTWEVNRSTNLLLRNEKKTSIFRLDEALDIPNDRKAWKYNIIFSAYDKTWEEASINYEFNYTWWNAPEFTKIYDRNDDDDNDNQYVHLNRWKIPNDWFTSFNLSTTVKDKDWADDIVEVRADLTSIWWDVIILERQWASVEWTAVQSSVFTATWITIPSTVTLWWHEFTMVANDKQWNQTSVSVEIKVTETDVQWKHIELISEKWYTQPPFATPWTWSVSLNVFVKNNWKKVETVIAYLENIAKYTWSWTIQSLISWTWAWVKIDKFCENPSDRIICMEPSIKEWREWQWFRLDDVQIDEETVPSTERYRIKVVAIQEWWKAIEWWTYLTVNDWTLPTYDNGSPKLQMAISTSPNSVQLVFSNPLDIKKLKTSHFKITNAEDVKERISIRSFTMSSDQKIVILKTSNQSAKTRYTVIADSEKIWLKEDSFTDNHKDFIWFDKDSIAPNLYKIETLSPTKIALYFEQWISPTSIEKNADNFKIFSSGLDSKPLKVLQTYFADDNNKILYLSTEEQVMNQKYTVLVQNLVSASWVPIWWYKRKQSRYAKWRYFWITKEFWWHRGENLHEVAIKKWLTHFDISNAYEDNCIDFKDFTMFTRDYKKWIPSWKYFDYNFDNKINFIDFTIFSKEYWKCLNIDSENNSDNLTWSWNNIWTWSLSWTWNITWTWTQVEQDIWASLIAPYN